MLTSTMLRVSTELTGGYATGTLTGLQVFLLFVAIPLGVVAAVGLLVFAPSWTRSGRSGPGAGWFAEPVWFHGPGAGPADDAAALPAAGAATTRGGGARARW